MNQLNLEFFETYKELDELCKQLLSSEKGVSSYIDEMTNEMQESRAITGWNKDYQQLKHMRWIRNQLAHETNAFQKEFVTIADIEWIKAFHHRILECTDPLALLRQSKSMTHKRNNLTIPNTTTHKQSQSVHINQTAPSVPNDSDSPKTILISIIISFLLAVFILAVIFFSYLAFTQ